MHRRVMSLVSVAVLGVSACTGSSDESSDAPDATSAIVDEPTTGIDADAPDVTSERSESAASGEDAESSVEDFCAAISAIRSADFELEETFGPEARALFVDVQSAAPPEVSSDVSTVIATLDAMAQLEISPDDDDPIAFEAASEILLDPEFTEANENLVAYTSEACAIDLGADDDGVDLDDLDTD